MQGIQWKLATLAAAAMLAACGGGGSEPAGNPVGVTSVKVMGDSLADIGTFAGLPSASRTATIQNTEYEPTVIWTERIAANLGAQPLCSFYRYNGTTFTPHPQCTSFAVGGARINNAYNPGGLQSPRSVLKQMQDAAAVSGGYKANELVLIDGGGNDAADLVGAYLQAGKDGGKAYGAMLGTLLPVATVQSLMSQPQGSAKAGTAYMVALADAYYAGIRTHVLDKGAQRVAVLNAPPITLTPRFRMALAAVGAAQGAAAATQAEAMFDAWVKAFNSRLDQNAAQDKRVAVSDFYTAFRHQMDDPAQYGFTNVTTPACPITGKGEDGLPTYTFATCTAPALSAMTPPAGSPAGAGANWWAGYAFADGFHPTPFAQKWIGQLMAKTLAQAGWL